MRALLDYDDFQQARKYWNKLAQRLRDEGATETVSQCHQLKLPATDGKMRLTDCADTETMLRIVQSIPSPKAEPFKQCLAQVGAERLEGMVTLDTLRARYLNLGYRATWVEARIQGILIRKQLTAEWDQRGADQPQDYALLTNEIALETFDIDISEHYAVKGLDPEHDELRDSYTEEEAIFMRLGELASTRLHRQRDTRGMPRLILDAREGGSAAGAARRAFEEKTGEPVVSPLNYQDLRGEPEARYLSNGAALPSLFAPPTTDDEEA